MSKDTKQPIKKVFETHDDIEIVWDKSYVDSISIYPSPFVTELNWHNSYEIKLFYDGEGRTLCGTEMYDVREGDILIISPLVPHASLWTSGTLRYDLIFVSPDMFRSKVMLGGKERRLQQIRFNTVIRNNSRAKELLSRFLEECMNKDDAYEMAAESILGEFFAWLIRTEVRDYIPESEYSYISGNLLHIAPAIRHIVEFYMESLTISELADICHLSQYHFCRVFQKLTGLTPIQFITKHRLEQAYQLLIYSDMSVSSISENVGYSDPGYFARLFKKMYGTTPTQTRLSRGYIIANGEILRDDDKYEQNNPDYSQKILL